MEITTLWLDGTVTEEVGLLGFHGASERFHGANNTVIRWHGYGRDQDRYHLKEPAILWLAGTR